MFGLQIPQETDSEGGEDTGTSEAVKTKDGRLDKYIDYRRQAEPVFTTAIYLPISTSANNGG